MDTSTTLAPTDARDRGGPRQPLLIVRNLRKHFPIRSGVLGRVSAHVRAVDGVSFTVMKGETLGIVGESGCGKSTVARLLMRLLKPDGGEHIFDGEAVGEAGGISVAEMRRQVQMVFQDSASSLNPRMPVQGSVAFGPIAFGTPRDRALAQARQLLAKVGLDPVLYGGRYPHELSGGQKQRVNVARALALDPRMVILDEAVSALDKSIEAQVLNLLQALRRELQLTYVFISHDLSVVRWISDRVMVMYLGRVMEEGPAETVFSRPAHPYTRALLSATPRLDPKHRVKRILLAGDPPSPSNPPSGCVFRTRCAHAVAACAGDVPALRPFGSPGQAVACIRAEALA